tara:strand:+ start:166 stop:372 length:207 start_codon:yes stop_codon:yes gene_type:complete
MPTQKQSEPTKPVETPKVETPKVETPKAVEDTSANAVVSRLSPEPNTDTSQKVEYKTRKGNTISTSKG